MRLLMFGLSLMLLSLIFLISWMVELVVLR